MSTILDIFILSCVSQKVNLFYYFTKKYRHIKIFQIQYKAKNKNRFNNIKERYYVVL